MIGFQTLVTYRDNKEDGEAEEIPIDSEDVVIGLQAFGVKPLLAKSDGRKLVVVFEKNETTMNAFQTIQASLAGALPSPLMVDYNQILLARLAWKGLLTMMRSVPITRT